MREVPFFIAQHLVDEVNVSNISPTDEASQNELLHNGYTYMHNIRRKITHCSFGNIKEQPLAEIWSSKEYKTFRRKFDEFDFASCLYCGHCELFEENREDCIGNTHPACGGCLWAEGVLSCP